MSKPIPLNKAAQAALDFYRQRAERSVSKFREEIAEDKSRNGLTHTIKWRATDVFYAEEMLRYCAAAATITDPEYEHDATLSTLHDEVCRRIDSWTPTNSTCLISRLVGEVELLSWREARKMIQEIIKLQGGDA